MNRKKKKLTKKKKKRYGRNDGNVKCRGKNSTKIRYSQNKLKKR